MAISKKARWAAARAASAGFAGAAGGRFGERLGERLGRIGFTGGPRKTWLTRPYRVDRHG
jgi:hypothetical protein